MDESWNFLIEASDEALQLLTDAVIKLGIVVSANDSRESLIRIICDNVDSNISTYSQYIEKICCKCWINTDGKTVAEKEELIIDFIISAEIGNMDEAGVQQFSKLYKFASKDKNSLKEEIRARSSSSTGFSKNMSLITVSLLHQQSSTMGRNLSLKDIINNPVIGSPSTNYSFENRINNDEYFRALLSITALLIHMSKEYNSALDENSSKIYLDKVIRTDETFENQKETAVSIMRTLFKTFGNKESKQYQQILNDVSIIMQGRETPIPSFLIRKMENWYESLLKYLMLRLFPLSDEEADGYENSSKNLTGNKVVFFDYRFPYTKVIEGACYARPKDKLEEVAILLFLGSRNVDVEASFLSEKELREGFYDVAVIREQSEIEDEWCEAHCKNKRIVALDPYLAGWEDIEKENYDIVDFIKFYLGLPLEDFHDGISEEMWEKAPAQFKRLREEVLLPLYHIFSENEQMKKDNEERFHRLKHFSTPNIGYVRSTLTRVKEGKRVSEENIDSVLSQLNKFEAFIDGFGKEKTLKSDDIDTEIEHEALKSVDIITEIEHVISVVQEEKELFSVQKEYDVNEEIKVFFGETEINEVLINIFENIKRHAFHYISNKKNKVIVRIEKTGNLYISLYILNNGNPFRDNVDKVFDYGQVYGEYGNTGEGLHRARALMNKYRGVIDFKSKPDKEFCVIVKLTFQRFNNQIIKQQIKESRYE